jgi:hypothetical protein
MRNYNTNLQAGVVIGVDIPKGQIRGRFGSGEEFNIPFKYDIQLVGAVDVSIPCVGDVIWVFSDASNSAVHIGGAPKYYQLYVQDPLVTKNINPEEFLLFPPLENGDKFVKAAQGGGYKLSRGVELFDSIGNKIIMDSDDDKIETVSGRVINETFNSQVHTGIVKRFSAAKDLVNDSVITVPGTSDYMAEFSVYLGTSLVKEVSSIQNYLQGSNEDPKKSNYDDTIGKDDTPALVFSMSDGAVVDIAGDSFPTLAGKTLNILLELADKFAFKVNSEGVFLLGNADSSGMSGLYVDSSVTSPFIRLGTSKNSQLVMHGNNAISLENAFGFCKIFPSGLVQASANGKVMMNLDPTDGAEKFEVLLSGSPTMSFTANSSGVAINAGGTILKFGSGEMQLNGTVNLGLPNPSTLGMLYEPVLLGKSLVTELGILNTSLAALVTALTTPMVGLSSWPSVHSAAAATLPVLTTFIGKLTASTSVGLPFLSKQVQVGS